MRPGDRRLDEVVGLLNVPHPFDVRELARAVGTTRGRPIELRPVRTPGQGPSGMWIATRDVDFVCYEAETSALHQEHIILHELGHMLCGHPSATASPQDVLQLLMPDLDPTMIRKVLCRTAYGDPEERQAELFAMLVLERGGRLRRDRRADLSAELAEVLDRIEAALTTPLS
ncbi:hypothetical protein [Kutzneria sp. NPDC052558]|uniref:hypothetical protein n=1 Tax=Kutzneria sp. NPDC052558 TaxID=3364121 RepID=UPI0037C654B0